jgi:hypothetical protein
MFCLLFHGHSVLSGNMFLPAVSDNISQETSAELCRSWTCLLQTGWSCDTQRWGTVLTNGETKDMELDVLVGWGESIWCYYYCYC